MLLQFPGKDVERLPALPAALDLVMRVERADPAVEVLVLLRAEAEFLPDVIDRDTVRVRPQYPHEALVDAG